MDDQRIPAMVTPMFSNCEFANEHVDFYRSSGPRIGKYLEQMPGCEHVLFSRKSLTIGLHQIFELGNYMKELAEEYN